jgi:site-specific recombinase XerD
LEASEKGLSVKEADAIVEGELLADVIAEYLDETEANKKWKTFLAYKRTLDLFSELCKKKFLKDVKRADVLAFKVFLKQTKHATSLT